MNFAAVKASFTANPAVMVKEELGTGLSIRGALIWLVHLIEFDVPGMRDDSINARLDVALSTKKGLGVMPRLDDDGCLAVYSDLVLPSAAGQYHQLAAGALRQSFLPPIPLASPAIHLYAKSESNDPGLASDDIYARLGFTTVELTMAVYTEIAETWGW